MINNEQLSTKIINYIIPNPRSLLPFSYFGKIQKDLAAQIEQTPHRANSPFGVGD